MRWLSNFSTMVFIACIFALYSLAAFAQVDINGFPVPDGDITKILIELASNPKSIGTLLGISTLIMLSVQAIKKFVNNEWKYKRLLTLSVAIIFSVVSELAASGKFDWIAVGVKVFIGAGGASALYEAAKGAGVIKKKAATLV